MEKHRVPVGPPSLDQGKSVARLDWRKLESQSIVWVLQVYFNASEITVLRAFDGFIFSKCLRAIDSSLVADKPSRFNPWFCSAFLRSLLSLSLSLFLSLFSSFFFFFY